MFIYKITNKLNGKLYIGQTVRTAQSRWNEHLYKLSRNKHPNSKLQAAWNKYGKDSFEFDIICECTSIEELNTLEELYVSENIDGYNLSGGGHNKRMSEESKQKLSLAKRGKPNGQKGSKRKPHSESFKTQLSKERRPGGYPDVVDPNGVVYTVTNVKGFAKQHNLWFSGLASLFGTTGTCFHYKGWRIATPETIGKKFSYEQYDKQKQISKGRRPQGFPMMKNPTGEIFIIEDTLTRFCKQHRLTIGNVSELINGKKTSYKGWTIHNPTEK
jgi:group I intron endonuclease